MQVTARDVEGRSEVTRLAAIDSKAALKLARAINHAWYRCQALTAVAEQLGGQKPLAVLAEAFAAAREQKEPNRIVTVGSWPVSALAKIDARLASEWAAELVAIANTEPHNLRRAHALEALALKTSSYPEVLATVVPALAEALLGGHGPRIDRVIRDTFEVIRTSHPHLLPGLAQHHKANRQRNRLLASISDKDIQQFAGGLL